MIYVQSGHLSALSVFLNGTSCNKKVDLTSFVSAFRRFRRADFVRAYRYILDLEPDFLLK